MAFDWYPLNPVNFKRDTYHLCAAADGIYRRLVDEYYITELPLPDNDQALAGIARVGLGEWLEHSAIVRAFFCAKGGKLYHKRCDAEINARSMLAAKRSHKAKEAATMRWIKEREKQGVECHEHAASNANAMLNDATLHNTSIITTTFSVAAREKPASEVPSGETEGCPMKKPTEASRADLDAIIERKRASAK